MEARKTSVYRQSLAAEVGGYPACCVTGWVRGQDTFLADLHSRFGLQRSQIVRLAERAAGRHVEEIERFVRGYDNEVYRVTLTGELVVYVRIRRHGEGTLEQEAWAMDLARRRRPGAGGSCGRFWFRCR